MLSNYRKFKKSGLVLIISAATIFPYLYNLEGKEKNCAMNSLTPQLVTDNNEVNKAFRICIGDIMGNLADFRDGLLAEPALCILAGLDYDTPWTRDTAINVWNGTPLFIPEAAHNTLLSVLRKEGKKTVVGGQYWDAIIWVSGAWWYYLYTGDKEFLALAEEASRNSLSYFEETEFDPEYGLFRGPACYGDGVAAYPDEYAKTGGNSGILDWVQFNPEQKAAQGYGINMFALSTNCLYYQAYLLTGEMAQQLHRPARPEYAEKTRKLKASINRHFWMEEKGYYRYLVGPRGNCDHQEGLGHSFALLTGIADEKQAERVLANQYITNSGIPCVWPTFSRYQKNSADDFGRHSGTVWPQIQGFWATAVLEKGAADKFSAEFMKLTMSANRDIQFTEIYHPATGWPYGGWQESAGQGITFWGSARRQTWSATAYFRMVVQGLAGMRFSPEGITFAPYLPYKNIKHLALKNLIYRKMVLNISIEGEGQIKEFSVNGRSKKTPFLDSQKKGRQNIKIVLRK